MAVLDVVLADVLVGEGVVGLCELDVVVVERLCRLILGRVGAGLVGVEFERESLVVGFDLLVRGGLRSSTSQHILFSHRPWVWCFVGSGAQSRGQSLTSAIPRISYGFQILLTTGVVVMMR